MPTPSREVVNRRLDAATAAACARGTTSPSRARQLRWVAGELRRALDHKDLADLEPDVRTLFTEAALGRYLALARAGELRVAPYRTTSPSPASERVRLDCLGLLAAELGLTMPSVARPSMPDLRTPVPIPQQRAMWARLDEVASQAHSSPARSRLLAMVGVVLDTGARAGELCAIHVDDLAPDLATVRFHRRPQAQRVREPVLELLPLSPGTQVALRHWLADRHDIVSRLQGSVSALWVSVRGNHAERPDGSSVPRPAGMPLHTRGLRRAYERAVDDLNMDLAGTPGWDPLPSRLEQLRRGAPGSASPLRSGSQALA
jgi:integrase